MKTLDTFTRAYVEMALFSSTDGEGEPLEESYDIRDLAPEALASMAEDCADFQAAHAGDISGREARAGGDFWLTRNGHGAGFWDGDWPADAGRRLTEAAHAYGSCELGVGDDGLLYIW